MIKQRFLKFSNKEEYESKYNELSFPSIILIENEGVIYKKTELITFYLYNNISTICKVIFKCTCEKGMTLEQWANSEYNDTDWIISGSSLKNDNTSCSGDVFFMLGNVNINNVIEENNKYNYFVIDNANHF